MISAQDHMTFPALQHVLLLLPRPGGCQRRRSRLLLRLPLPGGGLPSLSFPDLGRFRRGWVLCLPPAPPPPRPLRRLPPRPGPGAERPETSRPEFQKEEDISSTKYLSEPNLRPETDDAPTCRRQPAPRPCRAPPTLDGDRSAVQSRRVRGPITFPEQNQKRLDGYVL